MTGPAARRTSWLLPIFALAFALVSVLWFGLSFAVTVQLLADGSMRDWVHLVFGYADAAVEGTAVAGWIWALLASARMGTPVNGAMQALCGATSIAQLAALLAMAALMGGWFWDEPTRLLLGHAGVAVLLAILIGCAIRRRAGNGAR